MKISVIIPAYNSAHFLPRCLESVFSQTLLPAEVIVVDDGSHDDTADAARKLGAKVLSQPNRGPSAARNAGIAHATGDWIGFLDADDYWSPEKLEIQADQVNANTVLVYTGTRIFDDSGVRQLLSAIDSGSAVKMLRYRNPITNSSVIARREALLRAGGFREDVRTCEDWDMWVRLSRLGNFVSVQEPLTNYYVYPGSLSSDPQKMIANFEKMLHSTLVSDMEGLRRWVWIRRILAVQLYSAALIARENGFDSEMSYILRSLAVWPLPSWKPHRFMGAAASARRRLQKRNSRW